MPLPFAHGLVGAGIVAALHPEPARRRFAPLIVGALLANCADVDFALVFLTHEPMFDLVGALVSLFGDGLVTGIRNNHAQ